MVTISNQAPEGTISTMLVVKWSDAMEGPKVKLYVFLCDVLYKLNDVSIVTQSETDQYVKINCFTWSSKYNDWVVTGYQYNKTFEKW